MRTLLSIEIIEVTQTVERKQEVLVSTQKTIQIKEEDSAKGLLFRAVFNLRFLLCFFLFIESGILPLPDKENDVKASDNSLDEREVSVVESSDYVSKQDEKNTDKLSSDDKSENRETVENQMNKGNKEKVEISDGKSDGKKKKKRGIPKFLSCFSKKGAE